MPSWSKISEEIKKKGAANPAVNPFDAIRRGYLAIMHQPKYKGNAMITMKKVNLQANNRRM